jgi:hypothetical protein
MWVANDTSKWMRILVGSVHLLGPALVSMLVYGLVVVRLNVEGVHDTLERLASRFLPASLRRLLSAKPTA